MGFVKREKVALEILNLSHFYRYHCQHKTNSRATLKKFICTVKYASILTNRCWLYI